MTKFFQTEIAAFGGSRNSFKNVEFRKNNLENTDAASTGTVLEFIPVHIKNPPVIQFMAYIVSMGDDFNAQFSSEQPFGRTDPYYVWKSNSRKISINWAVPSSSTASALNNMNNLSWLLGALYPTFKDSATATSVAASPLFRVRFANLIASPVRDGMGLLCTIPGINVRHEVKDGFIGVNPKNMGSSFANADARIIKAAGFENSIREGKKLLIPKNFSLDCQLQVVHEHALGWNLDTGDFRGGSTGFPYQVGIMREGESQDLPSSPSAASDPASAATTGGGAGPAVRSAENTQGDHFKDCAGHPCDETNIR